MRYRVRIRACEQCIITSLYIFFLCTAADSPADLTAELLPRESGSFRVSWTPPASTANLTGYRIYYSGASGSGSVDVNASATEVTINDNKTSVTYTITVVALSPQLPSPAVNVTLPGENFYSKRLCCIMVQCDGTDQDATKLLHILLFNY